MVMLGRTEKCVVLNNTVDIKIPMDSINDKSVQKTMMYVYA